MICDHSGQKLDQKKKGWVCMPMHTDPPLSRGGGGRMLGVEEDGGWIWGLPSLLPTSLPPRPTSLPSHPTSLPFRPTSLPSLPTSLLSLPYIPPLPSSHPFPSFPTSSPSLPYIHLQKYTSMIITQPKQYIL